MTKELSGHSDPAFTKEASGYSNPTFTKEFESGHSNPGFTKDALDSDHVAISVDEKLGDRITYSWHKVNVFALPERGPFKGKYRLKVEKQILKDVTGICRPGELVAIMGASGAGKTTLLNVLTSRAGKNLRVEGDLFLNGKKMSVNDFTKRSAYVQQEDLFIGILTVMEQLVFQANLRMDGHIPKAERMARVEEVIKELGLTECRDTLIGIEGRIKGISGGETKRLAFACEVLTDPPLMLCDEPTSGLDSFMAETIVTSMKHLVRRGKCIISTIHQPSSEVFALFDRVLLMAEGRLAYLGNTSDALKFFSGLGKTCPFNYNPADFFISTLAVRPEQEEECQTFVTEFCDTFEKSAEMQEVAKAVADNMSSDKSGETNVEKRPSPYKAGWFRQLSALNKRSFLEMAREPMLLRVKIIQTIMIALIVGLIFLDTDYLNYDQSSVQNINGVLFLIVTNLTFQFCFGVVGTFCVQLPIFLREHTSGMYRTDTFYITKNVAELPGSIFLPILFLLVIYYMVNLYRDVITFFGMALALILVSNAALSYGYLISCLAKDLKMALAIAAPLLIPFMIFGGFFLNADSVHNYFIWLQWLSWINYGNEALVILQWRNIDYIECTGTCYYKNGTDVIKGMGFAEDELWMAYGVLVAHIFFYRILAYLTLLRRSYKGI